MLIYLLPFLFPLLLIHIQYPSFRHLIAFSYFHRFGSNLLISPHILPTTVFLQTTMNKSQRVSAKKAQKRALSTKSNKNKVAKKTQKVQRQSRRNLRAVVVGAAGGIGQPLSMLIKQNLHGCWTSLNVFDVNPLVQGMFLPILFRSS